MGSSFLSQFLRMVLLPCITAHPAPLQPCNYTAKDQLVGFALPLAKGCFCVTSSATQLLYPLKSHPQTYPGNMPPVTYILLPCKLFLLPVIPSHRSHFSFPPPRHPLFHSGLSPVLTHHLRRLSYTHTIASRPTLIRLAACQPFGTPRAAAFEWIRQ